MAQSVPDPRSPLYRATDPGDPSLGLVAWPGRRLEMPLHPGDRLVEFDQRGRSTADATVVSPQLLSRDDARRLGARADAPGRYVRIDGPRRAARLTGPDALLLGGLTLLRPGTSGEPLQQPSRPSVQLGSRGPAVMEAQQRLNAVHQGLTAAGDAGLASAPLQVDGLFGPATRDALSSFQRLLEVDAGRTDGVLDVRTWTELLAWQSPPPVLPAVPAAPVATPVATQVAAPAPATASEPPLALPEQADDIHAADVAANLATIRVTTRSENLANHPNAVDFNAIAYANTPSKRAAFRALTAAQTEAQRQHAGEQIRAWLQAHGSAHNRTLRAIAQELPAAQRALATAQRRRNAAAIAAADQHLADLIARRTAAASEVARLIAAFQPYVQAIRHNHSIEVDGVTVTLHDNVTAYATVTADGLEGSSAGDTRARVESRLASAISNDPLNILQVISRHEGTFSNVNTWDRAIVTFGFIQWTFGEGGDGSLVGLLAAIKRAHPQVFHDRLQRYGIDLFRGQVELLRADGTLLTGAAAAAAIQVDPKLTAVISRLGTEPAAQDVQIQHAVATKITAIRNHRMAEHGVTIGQLVTSSYGTGVMTDRVVGGGGGAVYQTISAALNRFVAANHGADLSQPDWLARAEPEVIAALAAMDPQRAASYAHLSHEHGSFTP